MWTSVLTAALCAQVAPSLPTASRAFPSQSASTVNIVQWDSNKLPRVYERSEQMPLTDDDLVKLAKEGFDAAMLVKMIEERRCACDASAEGMIRLKKSGVPAEVIQAVSLHGLKPNRALSLLVTLDFTGQSREARSNYLYFFVDDGNTTRLFSANLHELLSRKNGFDEQVDKSDFLIARTVRRVQFAGEIPLKTYGKHNVLVASSANPSLSHPSQLRPEELKNSQRYTFDYPRASLENMCRLTVGYRRDELLTYLWRSMGSRFECEWN